MKNKIIITIIIIIINIFCGNYENSISGNIYDSITKEPIPQANVAIYNAFNGEATNLITTIETDEDGYYYYSDDVFVVFNGECGLVLALVVTKTGYQDYTGNFKTECSDLIQDISLIPLE